MLLGASKYRYKRLPSQYGKPTPPCIPWRYNGGGLHVQSSLPGRYSLQPNFNGLANRCSKAFDACFSNPSGKARVFNVAYLNAQQSISRQPGLAASFKAMLSSLEEYLFRRPGRAQHHIEIQGVRRR